MRPCAATDSSHSQHKQALFMCTLLYFLSPKTDCFFPTFKTCIPHWMELIRNWLEFYTIIPGKEEDWVGIYVHQK